MATPRRGALLVIEGIDRSGKSTQARMLVDYLRTALAPITSLVSSAASGASSASSAAAEEPAKLMRFPERTTPIGKMIDAYLRQEVEQDDKAIHLLFAANRWELRAEMLQSLQRGQTLVVDRYSYSGVAFSSSKGLEMGWCYHPEIGLPAPDAVLFFDLPLDVAEQRGGYGDERYEKKEMQTKVADRFRQLREQDPSSSRWHVLDAQLDVEALHRRVRELAMDVISKVGDSEIGTLPPCSFVTPHTDKQA